MKLNVKLEVLDFIRANANVIIDNKGNEIYDLKITLLKNSEDSINELEVIDPIELILKNTK